MGGFWVPQGCREEAVQILYIGDSMFRWMSEMVPARVCGKVPGVVFQSGKKVDEVFPFVEASLGHSEVVVLHVGANDIKSGRSVYTCLANFKKLVTQVENLSPHIKIVISAVVLRAANQHQNCYFQEKDPSYISGLNQKISELNHCLKLFCNANPHLEFIDHARNQNICREFLAQDGLHFSRKGVSMAAQNIYNTLRHQLGPQGTWKTVDRQTEPGVRKLEPVGRQTADKVTVGRLTTDKPTTERLTTDKQTTGRLTTDKLTTERLTTDKPTTERLTTDKPTTGRLTN